SQLLKLQDETSDRWLKLSFRHGRNLAAFRGSSAIGRGEQPSVGLLQGLQRDRRVVIGQRKRGAAQLLLSVAELADEGRQLGWRRLRGGSGGQQLRRSLLAHQV